MSRVIVLPSLAIPVTQVRTTSQRTGKQSHRPSIKMGSDESHFNVSLIVRDKVTKTVSTNHNLFEEEGQPITVRDKGTKTVSTNHNLFEDRTANHCKGQSHKDSVHKPQPF